MIGTATTEPCQHMDHSGQKIVNRNSIEPRFGYVACEDHEHRPPIEFDGSGGRIVDTECGPMICQDGQIREI